MTEHRLFEEGKFPFTPEWYETREHAPHLEQAAHFNRLNVTAAVVMALTHAVAIDSIVDLGAGDGGLLALLSTLNLGREVTMWGYDLMPENVAYGINTRGVNLMLGDFLTLPEVHWGTMAIITECLEHLEDPHGALRTIADHSRYLVASSPAYETPESHDACHAWCWDQDGYRKLVEDAGWIVVTQEVTDGDYGFQILSAARG